MPRIPKARRQRIPSGRVGGVPTPMDIADTGEGIEARGLGALGRGVGALGQSLFQIEQAEGISQASTARGQAEAEMKLLVERLRDNNDPNTYSAALMESLGRINEFRPKNPIGAKRFDDYLEQATPGWESGIETLKIRKKQALIEGAYIADRAQAIINGDLEEANRLTIEARDQTGAITPQQAAKDLASAPALVIRSRVTSLLNDANRLSVAGEWGKASIAIEQAQAILDTVTDLDPETESLLRNRIATMRQKTGTDSEIATNKAIEDSYTKIIGGDIDIGAMITSIQSDPAISEKDSVKATDKITTFFNKWTSIEAGDVTNEAIYDELTQASEAVERGAMSPAAFEELYVDNKGKLTKEDQRTIRSKDIVATRTMQNRAFSEATGNTRPRLVELRDDELAGLAAARDVALKLKDLKAVNLLNFSIKKAQIQKWNFGRWRRQLRSQISQNENWSQKQIFTASDILADHLDKDIDVLMLEFENASPEKSILRTPPSDELKDIWPDLSQEDKAKIWELRLTGASIKEIIGEL